MMRARNASCCGVERARTNSSSVSRCSGVTINGAATEVDPNKQKATYSRLNDLFLDESFVMTIAPVLPVQLARAGVHGLAYSRHEDLVHTDTWLER